MARWNQRSRTKIPNSSGNIARGAPRSGNMHPHALTLSIGSNGIFPVSARHFHCVFSVPVGATDCESPPVLEQVKAVEAERDALIAEQTTSLPAPLKALVGIRGVGGVCGRPSF